MRFILLIFLTALPCWSLNSRHTYMTPEELQGFGDFNNDGHLDVLVIDRVSGIYRIGNGAADGSLTWSTAKPTGCPDAEALAVGTVNSATTLVFVITGKSANQLFLIDPVVSYTRPVTLTVPGVGPASVAAVDLNLAGNDPTLQDLMVSTHWNSPPNRFERHVLQSLPGGISPSSTIVTGASVLDRISRVQLDTGGPETVATILRGSSDSYRVLDASSASLPILGDLAGLPTGIDFVHSPFLGTTFSQFVFFIPGTPGINFSVWNGSSLSAPAARNIGLDPVRSVHLTDDGTAIGIAVIFNDGDYASLFTFDASGNPVAAGTIVPPAGEKLKGILSNAVGHFSAISGPLAGGSTTTTPYDHDGSSWNPGASSSLPSIGGISTRANVFVYDKEPVVNADAKLIETLHIPDWASTFSISSGLPGAMDIQVEAFTGQIGGLGSSSAASISGPRSGADDALVNQNLPEVSVSTASSTLGAVPIQISISPPGGKYSRYVTPELEVPDPSGISAYYRTDESAAWTSYTFGTPILPPGNTLTPFTVWFYAEDSSRKSSIRQAVYTFPGDPGSLDSDGDGVPDFVEIQNGLDPLAGPDSDEDGLTDLEELLLGSDPSNGSETATYSGETLELPPSRTYDEDGDGYSDFAEWAAGSDPFDAGSTPSASSLVEYRNTFDLNVKPLSHSGAVGAQPDRESFPPSSPDFSPTDVRVHDLSAALLGSAPTDDHSGGPLTNPYAMIESVPATGRDLFVIASTPTTFDCEQDSDLPGWGRELIRLVPIPTLDAGPISFVGSETSVAADWIAAAQAHYSSLPHEEVSVSLDLYDTLIYLIWERITGLKLEDRGSLSGSQPIGLVGFRDTVPDESQVASIGQLLDLQSYDGPGDSGYLLQSIESTIRSEITMPTHPATTGLRKLANEIYRASAGLNGDEPGLYPSPFETLRRMIRELPTVPGGIDGQIDFPGSDAVPETSYSAAHNLTSGDVSAADASLVHLLGLITPRSTQTYLARVTATTFAGSVPILEDEATLLGLRLFDSDGNPYVFPRSIDLPFGTTIEILAFTDRLDLPIGGGTALEVVSATITGFPDGSVGDSNQNAIEDAYENYFFGGPTDPFGDEDGDGFINLQEALDGTHPNDVSSTPDQPPLPRGVPPVRINGDGANMTFTIEFPSHYGEQVQFILQDAGGTLVAPLIETSSVATDDGLDVYSLTLPIPVLSGNFYRFRLALR